MPDAEPAEAATLKGFRETVTRTLAADSARMAHSQDRIAGLDDSKVSREALMQSLIWRSIFLTANITWRTAKFLFKLRVGDRDFWHLEAVGYIEPSLRRYQMDFGSYAETFIGGDLYGGLSGRALITLDAWHRTSKQPFALWVLGVLTGVTDATPTGETLQLRGSVCRELAVTVDLARAAELTDFALHVPFTADFHELGRLPLSVWVDDEHIRRVRFTQPPQALRVFEPGTSASTRPA